MYFLYIKHSPEYPDILRGGKGVSWLPNLDNNLYDELLESHDDATFPVPTVAAEYIRLVFSSVRVILFILSHKLHNIKFLYLIHIFKIIV